MKNAEAATFSQKGVVKSLRTGGEGGFKILGLGGVTFAGGWSVPHYMTCTALPS